MSIAMYLSQDIGFLFVWRVRNMQLSVSVLTFGAIQMFLLIASVYMTVFLRMSYSVRLSRVSILMPALQVLNLIVLHRHVVGISGSFGLLITVQVIFASLLVVSLVWLLQKIQESRRKLRASRSIREAIDYLPGGICFSSSNGNPILTNRTMNELVYLLTGNTIINAQTTWEKLQQFDSRNGCEKLDKPWLNLTDSDEGTDEYMFFSLPDSKIWRLHKEDLRDNVSHYIQMGATDISYLYQFSKKLYENNQRLAAQYERQQNLLANIVEINHEKEILAMKMRIHDDLGRSIITTKQHLSNETLPANAHHLAEIWSSTVQNLSDFTQTQVNAEISPELELQKAADMIGCRINFIGIHPSVRKTELLFFAAVREALTNAVRHANADCLNVVTSLTDSGYHVEISDNGTVPVSSVEEGGGLSNLRKRLEQEGATLEVRCADSVTLIIELPADKKEISQ